jgi:hypothetical protein
MLLFSVAAHVDKVAEEQLLEGLRELPSLFPQIRDFALGINISRRDDTFTYGMTMTFADVAAMESYLTNSIHETFVTERFKPLIERRVIVSFEIDDMNAG